MMVMMMAMISHVSYDQLDDLLKKLE